MNILPLTIALFFAATAIAPASAAPVKSTASRNIALGSTPIMGVNLSGCEFMINGALCPSPEIVRAYLSKGFRAFRMPFRGAQASDPSVVAKMKAAAEAVAAGGGYVILDRHDFGPTFDPALAAWWGTLIRNFPDSDHVMIDTMNEPKSGAPYQPDATGKSYATQVNAGIAAFRRMGFRHRLLIEWRGWSNTASFDRREASGAPCISAACSFDRAGGLKDPLGRTMISGHRYPDRWSSGTEPACVTDRTATQMVINVENAAIQRDLKLWIGEFAFGNARQVTTACRTIGQALIQRMRAVPAVYAGVSWWGGGPAWSETYLYKVEPKRGTFATAPASTYLKIITGR